MVNTPNGWPLLKRSGATFKAPNGQTVGCANDDVATVFNYLVDQWRAKIEPISSCYGFRASNAVNPYLTSLSQHQSGTAIDVNGSQHLYEKANPKTYARNPYAGLGFSQKELNTLRAIAKSIKGPDGHSVIRLGIDFAKGWRDAMHVEISGAMGTHRASRSDVAWAADQIRKKHGGVGAGSTVLKVGARGNAVKVLQRLVGVKDDGKFGNGTLAAVKRAQRIVGVADDGHWGPKSDAAYHKFVDGKLGNTTWKRWMANAKVKSRAALIRKIQVRSGTLTSVQKKYKLTGKEIDSKLGKNTWKVIQDTMGLTGDQIDGVPGKVTVSDLQRRIVRGRW